MSTAIDRLRRQDVPSLPNSSSRESETIMTSTNSKSRLYRFAEWRESRLAERGPWPRRVAVMGTAVAMTFGTGVAFAAWTSTGTGNAMAKAGDATTPTTTDLAAAAVTTGPLYPGGSAGDVYIKVNNPGSYPFKVTDVTGNGTITGAGGSGSCSTTGVTFTNQSIAAANQVSIPAGGNTTIKLAGAVSMDNTSQTGCQGALFTIPVTVSVTSG